MTLSLDQWRSFVADGIRLEKASVFTSLQFSWGLGLTLNGTNIEERDRDYSPGLTATTTTLLHIHIIIRASSNRLSNYLAISCDFDRISLVHRTLRQLLCETFTFELQLL